MDRLRHTDKQTRQQDRQILSQRQTDREGEITRDRQRNGDMTEAE